MQSAKYKFATVLYLFPLAFFLRELVAKRIGDGEVKASQRDGRDEIHTEKKETDHVMHGSSFQL